MKATKIIYWITTSVLVLMMLFSAYNYFTSDQLKQAFVHLGFPQYFRIELGIAKIIGALVLMLPVYARLKEWAYAAFAIIFISAFIAHTASGDAVAIAMMPLIFLGVLAASYISFLKLGG